MNRIYWLGASLVQFSAAGAIAYRMAELEAARQLWGWLPFWFHLLLWGGILCVAAWMSPARKALRRLGLAALSGLLASAGFAPFPFVPALWIAFVPLLLVHRELREEGRAGIGMGNLFAAFYTFNLLTTWWVSNSALAAGFFAMGVNAFFMCLPWLLATRLGRGLPFWAEAVLIAAAWMVFEWGHLRWDLTWPWLTLGNAFAHVPWMVQWYEWTGVPGGTAWILSLNFLFFFFWEKNGFSFFPKKENLKSGLLLLSKIALPVLVSLGILLWRSAHPDGGPVKVVVSVQPNYEPHYEKFGVSDRAAYKRLMGITKEALTAGPTDYVLYPETSLNDDLREHDLLSNPEMRLLDTFVAQRPGIKLVVGVSSSRFFAPGEPLSVYAFCNRSRTVCLEAHNSALQLAAGQREIPLYVKSKLVPGPETFPFAGLLGGIKPLTQLVDHLGGTLVGLGRQEHREVFRSPEGDFAVGPIICYESVFGEYVTEYVRLGANALIVLTNDGWWDNTPGHIQHLYFARLRAIETRRPVVRSANTGISAHIDALGNVLTSAPYGTEGYVRAPIQGGTTLTLYVRWGDWISLLAMAALGVFGLWAVWRKTRR